MKDKRLIDIDKMVQDFLKLGPVPVVLMRVLEVIGDKKQSLTRLITEISRDPIITAVILSSVNSSYYGLKARVAGLPQAVSLLGFNRISEIILSYTTRQMTSSISGKCDIYKEDLWQHSVKTALFCRYLSRNMAPGFQKISYSAGILHDIGKLAITATADEKKAGELALLIGEGVASYQAEEMVLGFSHSYLGFKILCKLKLSSELLKPVFEHHNCSGEFSSHNSMILAMANIFAKCNYPSEIDKLDRLLKEQLNTDTKEIGNIEPMYQELQIDMENAPGGSQLRYRL